jgi:hypothetical protein
LTQRRNSGGKKLNVQNHRSSFRVDVSSPTTSHYLLQADPSSEQELNSFFKSCCETGALSGAESFLILMMDGIKIKIEAEIYCPRSNLGIFPRFLFCP